MKRLKRVVALSFCLVVTLSQGAVSFARTKNDDPQDYSVNDVSFDVSNDHVYVNWLVGDSRTSYTVQLCSSLDSKPKHEIGTVVTAGYTTERADITDKVLKRDAGTYYAQVTVEKKAKGQGRAASTMGTETITAGDTMMIKQNRGNADETKTSTAASTAANQSVAAQNAATQTQAASTQSTGAQNTAAVTGRWVSLENDGWSYALNNDQKATGWFQVGDKWYYAGNGGAVWASAWIKSAAEEGVYYYVGYNGEILVSAQTPSGYLVDYTGKWRP